MRIQRRGCCAKASLFASFGPGLALSLGLLSLAAPAYAKKKKKAHPVEQVAPGVQAAAAPAPPEEPVRRDSGDESFGGEDEASAGTYTLRTLVQTRFVRTAPDFGPDMAARLAKDYPTFQARSYVSGLMRDAQQSNDGMHLERVFLRATASPARSFGVKLLVDFGELIRKNQKKALKLAFGELRPTKDVIITAGLFKIPFSLLELLPIADYEFADVGPTDTLVKDLGFAGRDVGAMVDVAPLHDSHWLHVQAGVFNGDNDGPQRHAMPAILATRLSSRPFAPLRVGVDCAYRPHSVSNWDSVNTEYEKYAEGGACSADAAFSVGHFSARGEWLAGKRTDTPSLPDRKNHDFMAVWAIASYRLNLSRKMVLMPALRAEWLDEDQPGAQGQTTYLTAAINLELSASARLLFDLSRSNVQVGTRDRSAATPLLKSSAEIGVVQLQLKL